MYQSSGKNILVRVVNEVVPQEPKQQLKEDASHHHRCVYHVDDR